MVYLYSVILKYGVRMKIQLSEHFNYKKLIRFTFPSVMMMIFMSVYGIVDGLFVSNFAGDIPFKAINLVIPYIMILSTVGFMFGSGGTAIIANARGEGNDERANKLFSLFVYLILISGTAIAIISFIFMRPICQLLGAEGELLESCVLYSRIILCALPFSMLQFFFQSFFVAAERPKMGFASIATAGVTNMILDALLVGLLPLEYKLAGAAIATGASQIIGGIIPIIYFASKNSTVFRLGRTNIDVRAIGKACFNGSSEFMTNVSMNLVGMLYNLQLIKYAGEDGIAAYGAMMYICMIFSAIFLGYSIGAAPIISYHDGAQNHTEKKGILKKSLVIISVISICMFILAEILATPLTKLFVGYSDSLVEMTVYGFRIFSITFLLMGIAIFGSSFFTALGDGLTSAIISFLRTLVFQLVAVMVMPVIFGGVDGIWWSVVLADVMAMSLTLLFIIVKRKRFNY